jgi:hypothetical protein
MPSRRSASSSSTVTSGLPEVCGAIASTRRAASAGPTVNISETMVTSLGTPRTSGHTCSTRLSSRQRVRWAARNGTPSGMRPAHWRSSMKTTRGRSRDAIARTVAAEFRCARTCAVSGSPGSGPAAEKRGELRHDRGAQPPRSAPAPRGCARGPGPARPPARPGGACARRKTPDGRRRTRCPAGTGRTCRRRTTRHSP